MPLPQCGSVPTHWFFSVSNRLRLGTGMMPLLNLLRRTSSRLGPRCPGQLMRVAAFTIAVTNLCLLMPVMAKDLLDKDSSDIVPTTVPNAERKGIDLAKLNGQIVVVPDDTLALLNDFSFDMKVRFSDFTTGNFFQLNDDWDENGFFFQLYEQQLVLGFGGNGELSQVKSPHIDLQTKRWYRLSGIKDVDEARIFVDGKEIAKGNVNADIVNSYADFYIGRTGYSPPVEVAEFRLWPQAVEIGSDDAFDVAENGDGLPLPLIHYELQDDQSGRVTNLASARHEGRIEGSPHDVVHALDLSQAGNAIVVDRLAMPNSDQDFALKLDVMFDDLHPGVIAHAESEQGAFFSIEYDEERLLFTLGDGREQNAIVSPDGPLETGEWVTIAALYEDGLASMLVSGVRVASFKVPSGLDGELMQLSIGKGYNAAAFNVGAVKVWGRSLTDKEDSADLLSKVDLDDPDLLLALGPWEQRPEHDGLENLTGRGPNGTLLGEPSNAWTEVIQPSTNHQVGLDAHSHATTAGQ